MKHLGWSLPPGLGAPSQPGAASSHVPLTPCRRDPAAHSTGRRRQGRTRAKRRPQPRCSPTPDPRRVSGRTHALGVSITLLTDGASGQWKSRDRVSGLGSAGLPERAQAQFPENLFQTMPQTTMRNQTGRAVRRQESSSSSPIIPSRLAATCCVGTDGDSQMKRCRGFLRQVSALHRGVPPPPVMSAPLHTPQRLCSAPRLGVGFQDPPTSITSKSDTAHDSVSANTEPGSAHTCLCVCVQVTLRRGAVSLAPPATPSRAPSPLRALHRTAGPRSARDSCPRRLPHASRQLRVGRRILPTPIPTCSEHLADGRGRPLRCTPGLALLACCLGPRDSLDDGRGGLVPPFLTEQHDLSRRRTRSHACWHRRHVATVRDKTLGAGALSFAVAPTPPRPPGPRPQPDASQRLLLLTWPCRPLHGTLFFARLACTPLRRLTSSALPPTRSALSASAGTAGRVGRPSRTRPERPHCGRRTF